MRIGILNFHRADNFGCVLQCFGLQETVKELYPDSEVEIIQFPRKSASKNNMDEENVLRAEAFQRFRETYLNTCEAMIRENGEIDPDRYDVCIVGSDLVWLDRLVTGRENVFFLRFAGKHTRKISYAASAGDLSGNEARTQWLLEQINGMDAISIRESSTQEILKKHVEMPISVCLDPSLLHNEAYWERYEKKPEKLGDEKYVLMYGLGYPSIRKYDKKAAEMAAMIAEETGYGIIHYYYGLLKEWMPKESKHCFCEGPQELLWLFHHSEYVICSSFHATAFSVIFKRPFYTFHLPEHGNRMKDFVTSVGLPDRYLYDTLPKDEWDWEIPWDEVNTALQKKREESLDYLRREIGVANE